jgi:FlgD Ig-like domain
LSRTGLLAVVLVLLGGSVAAFAWTEKLKLKPAPVSKAHFVRHFSPTCGCHRSVTRLIFQSRGPERVDVSIVDANGDFVANLAEGKEIPKGHVTFVWDGRDESGKIVSDGLYRAKVRLHDARRTLLIPAAIHVDTKAPKVSILSVQAGAGATVRYQSTETARPILQVDGKPVFHGMREHAGTAQLQWPGPWSETGSHDVTLVLVDRAGNRSEPSDPVAVDVR